MDAQLRPVEDATNAKIHRGNTTRAVVRLGGSGSSGQSREFHKSGSGLYGTFLMAIGIVYLLLAAQFESFRHPAIITTVPPAVAGALLGLWWQGGSINTYSQIGALILIGLATKNGILIVEFANQLRDRGVEFFAAIREASVTRPRPVLMTSLCSVFGAVPPSKRSQLTASRRRARSW